MWFFIRTIMSFAVTAITSFAPVQGNSCEQLCRVCKPAEWIANASSMQYYISLESGRNKWRISVLRSVHLVYRLLIWLHKKRNISIWIALFDWIQCALCYSRKYNCKPNNCIHLYELFDVLFPPFPYKNPEIVWWNWKRVKYFIFEHSIKAIFLMMKIGVSAFWKFRKKNERMYFNPCQCNVNCSNECSFHLYSVRIVPSVKSIVCNGNKHRDRPHRCDPFIQKRVALCNNVQKRFAIISHFKTNIIFLLGNLMPKCTLS